MVNRGVSWLMNSTANTIKSGVPTRPARSPLLGLGISLGEAPPASLGQWNTPDVEMPDHAQDQCPACQLHRELAEAERLAFGLVKFAEPDGTIPKQRASTLPLIHVALEEAAETCEALARRRQDLAPEAYVLRQKCLSVASSIPTVEDLNLERAKELYPKVNECWEEGSRLADLFFTPPKSEPAVPATEPNAVAKWYEDARAHNWDTETAMSHLKEVTSGNG
jgi:hypothetical protein